MDEIQYRLDRLSIHAAREGGDGMKLAARSFTSSFQSTPPVKAATKKFIAKRDGYTLSIHAAREGGDAYALAFHLIEDLSIHAAREGGDQASYLYSLQ